MIEPFALVEIAADQQAETAGKLKYAHQRQVLMFLTVGRLGFRTLGRLGLIEPVETGSTEKKPGTA